ncbi:uncharacterized protein LOC111251599 isoform X3 [Varroa destructor]|uniref:Protein FAM60A n=1 Tax=Varroa destructor TaxID=109461 RepID=A0A7M7KD82_VARDE|nr:uncharacterized protein LOC111251599 isoform X3 [Varroa destructor]
MHRHQRRFSWQAPTISFITKSEVQGTVRWRLAQNCTMFSFHKPKIYRSVHGCCICRAKSSSSRFTDSAKYESEFEKCFKIRERRTGEICNACVLLVKRWKKLPPGTTRHWNHVVDARAGPGTKGTHTGGRIANPHKPLKPQRPSSKKKPMKPPRRLREIESLHDSLAGVYGEERIKRSSRRNSDGFTYYEDAGFESDSSIESDSGGGRLDAEPETPELSSASSAEGEDEDDWEPRTPERRKPGMKDPKEHTDIDKDQLRHKRKNFKPQNATCKMSSFIDNTFWRKERICCGVVFKGPRDELLIYPKLLKPCACRLRRNSASSQHSHSQDSNSSACVTPNSEVLLLPTSPESLSTSDTFPTAYGVKRHRDLTDALAEAEAGIAGEAEGVPDSPTIRTNGTTTTSAAAFFV